MKPGLHIQDKSCDLKVVKEDDLVLGLESLLDYGDSYSDRGIGRSHVPEVVEGSYADLEHNSNSLAYGGLENYVLDSDRDMFFVDDHNHALAGWIAATYEGLLEGETLLVHVDFHEDDVRPPRQLHSIEESGYFLDMSEEMPVSMEEVNRVVPELEINEFIDPALEWKLFDDVEYKGLKQDSGEGFESDISSFFSSAAEQYDSVVADIDIDFMMGVDGKHNSYSPEIVNFVEKTVARTASEADFVTWATSPGFMDHEEAVEQVRQLAELSDEI